MGQDLRSKCKLRQIEPVEIGFDKLSLQKPCGCRRASLLPSFNFMRILGLDPGTATVGYGLIEVLDGQPSVVTYGVLTTSPDDGSTARRLQIIYEGLNDLIEQFKPDAAAVEELFFGRNITTAVKVGQARGVLLLALANAGIPAAEYSPPKIKEAVSGYGKASKQQVQFMVQNILELDEIPRPDDAADGLAVALTHFQHYRFESLVSENT